MPPSVNALFAGFKRRYKSKKYKAWEKEASLILTNEYQGIQMNPDVWLKMRIDLHTPLYYKNGNVKRIDCANYEKATTDMVSEFLGFNDMMIVDNRQTKTDSAVNEAHITISEIDL